MSYQTIYNTLQSFSQSDYPSLIKTLISLETNIKDEHTLDQIYAEWFAQDNLSLLNETLIEIAINHTN